ncbi:endonuclease-reverse transcriptase [Plakobranchus ocellatus]|uniref:Endonuclease-reverse transcriptase n=1 Tax=Plakobranchus ocellatus TaxID=259542 RepID=A0AAV4DT46_9GAST|nr:endonuclease-reverse transcriptase [Plakobranchus ocellatus]
MWMTDEILALCDIRRSLKERKKESEGGKQYRETNLKVKRSIKEATEKWIEDQCEDIENSLKHNNSNKAYKIVKELTDTKQARATTIESKEGKCLTQEKDILERWTEYCSELYTHVATGKDPNVLNVPPSSNNARHSILRGEIIEAVSSLKPGKSAGIDNITGERVKAGGEATIDMLLLICNKILQTGVWPKPWTLSLVITLPKKGNLKLRQNYRTIISLISHPSKVMLKVILNRLKPEAENIIVEEQAGFRPGRSTVEQICNIRILMEKYLQHQQELHHVFIDFKNAFGRVWHEALWSTMRKYNINSNFISVIENLYNAATSAVFYNNNIRDWFRTTVGVRQGCLFSPTLFNIFLERIMTDALEDRCGTVNIGGRPITNLRFADDTDGLAGNECELASLVEQLDKASSNFSMEISAEKTKIMTNSKESSKKEIRFNGQILESVAKYKYLGSIISDEGSLPEILSRIAQTIAALTKLKPIWYNKNIAISSKIRPLRSLVMSIFLYTCELWTLNADIERRIRAMEMRCYRRLLGISYKDHTTNEEGSRRIENAIGPHVDLLTIVRQRKLK